MSNLINIARPLKIFNYGNDVPGMQTQKINLTMI
jgi:hypothetical protein